MKASSIQFNFVTLLSLIFILRPNLNHVSHSLTRISDAAILGFIVIVVIFHKRLNICRDFMYLSIPYNFWLFLVLLTISLPLSSNASNFLDLFEVMRYPLFIMLPFLIGYKYINCNNRKIFFKTVLIFSILLMFLQFSGLANNLFIKLYSQANLNQGRATGVALFIQECAWIILVCCAVLSDYYVGAKRKIIVYIVPGVVLLTASKTAILMYIFFVFFAQISLFRKDLLTIRFWMFSVLALFLMACLIVYLAENFLQFRVSLYDSVIAAINGDYSDKSFSQRIHTFDRLLSDIELQPLSVFYGTDPLFLYRTLRYEMSFFNISAKIGLVGFLCICIVYSYPMFLAIKNKFISPSTILLTCVFLSIVIASVTGASMEGIKGSFIYFLALGSLYTYNREQKRL
ncbi:hypothetical protein [Shewanella chilikensis]|uniref:hypothetical protein n=1 Tax=Shewanella chilikensis TaxID=558541 RepID=UPI001CD72FE3|nr:hypothetical protein [Shewanella chilikensis]MCA0950243.1 hypothetical protein [Shewanella chilikensis]